MKDYIHKEYPKTCEPDDFFGQVKRTVNGKPVSPEQIAMIVSAITSGLELAAGETLVDIGCGNGALSQYLFERCDLYQGVDFSEYLIEVAQKNFENPPLHTFKLMDAVQYVETEPSPERFEKALCYGVFSYFSPASAERLLSVLKTRFTGLKRIFIGNLPDRDLAARFYPEGEDFTHLLDDAQSPLGIWRSQDFMRDLAASTGWNAEFRKMPDDFYASRYRFDAILTPGGDG